MENNNLKIYNAHANNLKNLNLEIPHDQLTVITGPSGSGKSSLLTQTLYNEAQVRFVQLAAPSLFKKYDHFPTTNVEVIENLRPTLHIGQSYNSHFIHQRVCQGLGLESLIRTIFCRFGITHCPNCKIPIKKSRPYQILKVMKSLPKGKKTYLLTTIPYRDQGSFQAIWHKIQSLGLVRLRYKNQIVMAENIQDPFHQLQGRICIVIDRFITKDSISDRLIDSIELAFQFGPGPCHIWQEEQGQEGDLSFTKNLTCPKCFQTYKEPTPQIFSPHKEYNSCRSCGSSDDSQICSQCLGTHLGPFALAITWRGLNLAQIYRLSLIKFWDLVQTFSPSAYKRESFLRILQLIESTWNWCRKLKLEKLCLGVKLKSIPRGDVQKIRLVPTLTNSFNGLMYLFDEPCAGVRPQEVPLLGEIFINLVKNGNTVVVIEHDPWFYQNADYIIELGPVGGPDGGLVIDSGSPEKLKLNPKSLTGQYIKGSLKVKNDFQDLRAHKGEKISLEFISPNQNKSLYSWCLGELVVFSDWEDNSDSEFYYKTLLPALKALLAQKREQYQDASGMTCLSHSSAHIDHFVEFSEKSLHQKAKSTCITLLDIYTEVRNLFAKTQSAKVRGYPPQRFHYNNPEGQCTNCLGQGQINLKENMLENISLTCPLCNGLRFNSSTLEITWKQINIGEVLNLGPEKAKPYFTHHPKINQKLELACQLGLGPLTLGQSATQISGGELQRLRLVKQLSPKSSPYSTPTLFSFLRPSIGLHQSDLNLLFNTFEDLLKKGHSIIVMDHRKEIQEMAHRKFTLPPREN